MEILSTSTSQGTNEGAPTPPQASPLLRARRLLVILACLCLVLTTFFVHFRHLKRLGLYEDDYWGVAITLNNPEYLSASCSWAFHTWMLGRPLNGCMPQIMTAVGNHIAGLPGIYFLAFLGLSLNCLLVFRALSLLLNRRAAFFGALVYCLFPADSTRPLLVHAGHVQGSMTFLLIALNLLLSNRWVRFLAYPIAGLSLLAYETAFLPFVVAPFLRMSMSLKFVKRLLIHAALCAVIVAVVVAVRLHFHEARAVDSLGNPSETLWHMVSSLWIGPETCAKTFGLAFTSVFRHFSTHFIGIAIGVALCFYGIARRLDFDSPAKQGDQAQALTESHPMVLFCVGVLTMSWSYLFSIVHYPPTYILGRFTSVHVATAWGAAVMAAALFAALAARFTTRRSLVLAASTLVIFTFANYGCFMEHGYVDAWKIQQRFWKQVTVLAPDISANTLVLVVGDLPKQNPVINSSVYEYVILPMLSRTSGGEVDKTRWPRCVVLGRNHEKLRVENGQLLWNPDPWDESKVEQLDEKNVILLHSNGDNLERVDSWFFPSINRQIYSKAHGPNSDFWKQLTPLGKLMLKR